MIFNLRELKKSYSSERNILKPGFYSRDTSLVARELLGKILVKESHRVSGSEILSGVIIETEAYYGKDDPASHASKGKTSRSEIMFGRAGMAYVYLCYGMYFLLNAVTEEIETPGAVLIRAVVPLEGKKSMATDGPGKLTVAFGINISDNKKDLTCQESDLKIYDSFLNTSLMKITSSPRIGISSAKDKYLRYKLTDIKFLF